MKKIIPMIIAIVTLASCDALHQDTVKPSVDPEQGKIFKPSPVSVVTSDVVANQNERIAKKQPSRIYKGSGQFIRNGRGKAAKAVSDEPITLNFQDQEIGAAVQVVFDVLGGEFWVDPAVSGKVTIQAEIPKSALLPTMEAVLKMNDVVVVYDEGVYKVVPLATAKKGLLVPTRKRSGYRAQVFALKYIAASEMAKIVSASTADKAGVVVDDSRNLLIVSGTGPELKHIAESVSIFDVNWLRGMSVGIFNIANTEAKAVADELNQIIDKDKNPNASLIRIVHIERINALLVITPQPQYLDQIGVWVRRLDQAGSQAGQRLYVYYVQNGKAAELADILNQVVGDDSQSASNKPKPQVAVITNVPNNQGGKSPILPVQATNSGIQFDSQSEIRVIADEVNNALLIKADPAGYRLVRDALVKLDITPLQVLIEVTIAEVILRDDLEYGVEWFFKNSIEGAATANGTLDLGLAGIANAFTGFQYTISKGGDSVRAVIEALEDESDVKILSSPSILVLNNQTAQIEVGDEVPILTQQSTSSSQDAADPFVVNSVEYKQTGILLNVTPRVNVSGLVTLEVVQEVSDVVNTQTSAIDSPTITQRKIETLVAVNSEQTVILGGLIREQNEEIDSGIPYLKDVPIIGPLFGRTSVNAERSELMIMITPHVIENHDRARKVTDEFRRKMKGLSVFDL